MSAAPPRVEIHPDLVAAASAAARLAGDALRAAVESRGGAALAISGGASPAPFFAALARAALPWESIDVFQVDERVAPDGDESRNATSQRAAFAAVESRHPKRFHWMPVTASDLDGAASLYLAAIRAAAGTPPVLDVVHLGLGSDGHTASLFPGERLDPAMEVAVTAQHGGWRRMTLNLPLINRAKLAIFLVGGASKRQALAALRRRDAACVAARVDARDTVVLADRAAAQAAA
jgi:6-phosphogluconolactonase